MNVTEYLATLKHDSGTHRIKVASLSGKKGAIRQITQAEHCPERAILSLTELTRKNLNP